MNPWLARRVLSVVTVVPALVTCYVITYALIIFTHYTSSGILSSVFIGDLDAWVLGSLTQDWQFRFLMTFDSFSGILKDKKPPQYQPGWRRYAERRVLGFSTLFIALPINYSIVYILVNLIHFQTVWVLSAVFIGDAVGFVINSLTLDYQWRYLLHFDCYKAIIPGAPSS